MDVSSSFPIRSLNSRNSIRVPKREIEESAVTRICPKVPTSRNPSVS